MQTNLIDISENEIFETMPEVLSTLLRDHTLSGTDPKDFKHIKWATHDYEASWIMWIKVWIKGQVPDPLDNYHKYKAQQPDQEPVPLIQPQAVEDDRMGDLTYGRDT